MIGTLTVNGMVLSAMPIGDYDKRLTILTVERGKISAFVRGARKPNSSLLACSQPFSYGEFTVYAGRDSYTVTAAQVSNYFQGLRQDPVRVYLGIYFCEFADYFAREGNDERELLGLLYQSLRALESGKFSQKLVRHIFELKAVCIDGEAPLVYECVCCGLGKRKAAGRVRAAGEAWQPGTENQASIEEEMDGRLTHFYMKRDGMVCTDCAKKLPQNRTAWDGKTKEQEICQDKGNLAADGLHAVTPDNLPDFVGVFPLGRAALYAAQYVVSTPCTQLYRFTLAEDALAEFGAFVGLYIKKHVNHEMKALQVLEMVAGGGV